MTQDTTNDNEQTQEQLQIEKEARLLGWVEKENYRDGDHFVDAEAFVKRGKEINPILRKNNELLLKKLDEANREIADVKKVAKEFEKFQKENAERQVKQLEGELSTLKEQKKLAITQGDGEQVVAIDEAIDAVKEQQRDAKTIDVAKPEAAKAPVTLDPVITGWMEKNTWFTTDDKYTRVADAVGASLAASHPELRGQAFFDQLDIELEDVLPAKYKKQTRTSPVEGSTNGGGASRASGGKQTYANLPADAKAACDKFTKQGFMTREAYVAEYDWS